MIGRRLRGILGDVPETVEELAHRAAGLERTLAKVKQELRAAGGAAAVVDEPWVTLDYEPSEIKLVASAWRRRSSVAKERHTVDWLERTLRPDDVFYDVGANVGAYSLVAAVTQPGATVFSFEPGFESYAALCRNIALNELGGRITALPVALGSRTELVDFGYRRLAAGSAQHHVGRDAPFSPVFTQRLIGARLDDLVALLRLPAPTHVKVDVDGAELAVLAGAESLLASPALRELQVETEPGDDSIERALSAHGFAAAARYETPKVVNVRFTRPD